MEDPAEYFKSCFQNMHKRNTFGVSKTTEEKMANINVLRKETRSNLLLLKRNIDENMSPFNTPDPNRKVKETINVKENLKKSTKRWEELAKWKAEKEKKKLKDKQKAKPIFKVCHIPVEVGLPNFDTVNKEIKGKLIKKNPTPKKTQFAPPNHTFSAPENIKPIHFNTSKDIANKPNKNPSIKKPLHDIGTKRLTRQQSNKVSKAAPLVAQAKPTVPNAKYSPKRRKNSTNYSSNSKKPTPSKVNLKNNKTDPVKDNVKIKFTENKNKELKHIESKDILKANDNAVVVSKTPKKATKTPRKNQNVNSENSILIKNEILSTEQNNTHCEDKLNKPMRTPKAKNSNKTPPKSKDSETKKKLKTPKSIKKTRKQSLIIIDDEDDVTSKTPVSEKSTVSVSPDYPVDYNNKNNSTHEFLNNSVHTPAKAGQFAENELSPVYISPFVTISRGKESAKKEFITRKHQAATLQNSPLTNELLAYSNSQAGAEYFTLKLNREIDRINNVCEHWSSYKKSKELPEEANDMIDVALGQSNLLIAKKFEQFRGLINQCKNNEFLEKPITCEDLHGFWDMMYMQVEDLSKRFTNLESFRTNNWQEVMPEKKKPPPKKRGRPPKITKATSSLKDMIRAARNKQKSEDVVVPEINTEKVFDGGYFSVCTPVKENTSLTPNKSKISPARSARKSLRVSVLASETSRRFSSPALTVMKVTQAIKLGDGVTPGKSILKIDGSKSANRRTKAVLFKDNIDDEDLDNENTENNSNAINLISFSPADGTPLRRSKRFNKKVS